MAAMGIDVINQQAIATVIFGEEDSSIQQKFKEKFPRELSEFIALMSCAFGCWEKTNNVFKGHENKHGAYVSALLYAALHSHVVSLKLFISGLFVPAGNTQRYAIESIAMAVLLSKPNLGVLKRYMNDEYSTTKAVRDMVRNYKELNLNKESLSKFESAIKLYNEFSHPTQLSLGGGIMYFSGKGKQLIFGGAYDPEKEDVYLKEFESKNGLAHIFPNTIKLIENNYKLTAI